MKKFLVSFVISVLVVVTFTEKVTEQLEPESQFPKKEKLDNIVFLPLIIHSSPSSNILDEYDNTQTTNNILNSGENTLINNEIDSVLPLLINNGKQYRYCLGSNGFSEKCKNYPPGKQINRPEINTGHKGK